MKNAGCHFFAFFTISGPLRGPILSPVRGKFRQTITTFLRNDDNKAIVLPKNILKACFYGATICPVQKAFLQLEWSHNEAITDAELKQNIVAWVAHQGEGFIKLLTTPMGMSCRKLEPLPWCAFLHLAGHWILLPLVRTWRKGVPYGNLDVTGRTLSVVISSHHL